jgi:hypothetical protein
LALNNVCFVRKKNLSTDNPINCYGSSSRWSLTARVALELLIRLTNHVVNMLEEDSNDESINETIDEKVYRELEVTAVYLMILYSTLTSGASSKLENVDQVDEIIIARTTEGELNA